MYGIPAPVGAQNHTPEFTACAKTEEAHDLTFKAVAGMAAVGLRFLADAAFADQVSGLGTDRHWECGDQGGGPHMRGDRRRSMNITGEMAERSKALC